MSHRELISVLIAEDVEIIRAGLSSLLGVQPDISVAEVAHGDHAVAHIEMHRPSVVIVDLELPGATGLAVARRVREAGLPTAVLILSRGSFSKALMRETFEVGASGILLVDASERELEHAVRTVVTGHAYLSPSADGNGPPVATARLSGRERDVLTLLANGLSSKEIASQLGVSVRTVDTYRTGIMDKTGIRHVPGLVKYALRHHLTTLGV